MSDKQPYFKLHKNLKDNPHYFMSEELLVPRCNNCDTQRINMFSNHINQFVHLKNPEVPKVFTRFENQIGDYSIAKKVATNDFRVIRKIVKNKFNYVLIIQYLNSGVYDVIEYKRAKNISEDYGYALNDYLGDDVTEETIVRKDEPIYMSDNYDSEGNFGYGVNLKAVFLPWNQLTYEDGIVISESAAKKLVSYKVEETMFSVNNNDILLNLYGNDESYISIPRVGDQIEDGILVASRRVDYKKSLYDLQSSQLKKIDNLSDDITFTAGGQIVDIEIYSNTPLDVMKEKSSNVFQKEVTALYEDQLRFYTELAEALEEIIPAVTVPSGKCPDSIKKIPYIDSSKFTKINGAIKVPKYNRKENSNKYTDQLGYLWKMAHEAINPNIKWRYDSKNFANMKIKITVLKESPISNGVKISGRYGNKGIISMIVPDWRMPTTKDGVRAEVCLNALGVINRLNMAQLYEQHINFMSDHVVKQLKETNDLMEKENLFFKYLSLLNKEQADFLEDEYFTMSRMQKTEFFKDIEENGIHVHQQPFFGNTPFETFEKIYKEMPEICERYEFEGIEKPLVMGDLYFIRLKHESTNKASMRSTGSTNSKNLPAKSALKKAKKVRYSNTPIRLGEMEVNNLLISKRPDIVAKLLKSYSTSDADRDTLNRLLITSQDPFNLNLEIPDDHPSISRTILNRYLEILDLELLNDTDVQLLKKNNQATDDNKE